MVYLDFGSNGILFLYLFLYYLSLCQGQRSDFVRNQSFTWNEMKSQNIYIRYDESHHVVITNIQNTATSNGVKVLEVGDRIVSSNHIPILSISLQEFLEKHDNKKFDASNDNEDNEAIVPVIEEESYIAGGHKLIGFVSIKVFHPKNVLVWNHRETTSEEDKKNSPLPHTSSHTNRVEIEMTVSDIQPKDPVKSTQSVTKENKIQTNIPSKITSLENSSTSSEKIQVNPSSQSQKNKPVGTETLHVNNMPTTERLAEIKRKTDSLRSSSNSKKIESEIRMNNNESFIKITEIKATNVVPSIHPTSKKSDVIIDHVDMNQKVRSSNPKDSSGTTTIGIEAFPIQIDENGKVSSVSDNAIVSMGSAEGKLNSTEKGKPRPKVKISAKKMAELKLKPRSKTSTVSKADKSSTIYPTSGNLTQHQVQQDKEEEDNNKKDSSIKPDQPILEDFFGEGKPYPEPYIADKITRDIITDRQKKRYSPKPFIYSVKFRNGPLGLAFENKISDATKVEKVIAKQQADLADIRVGDYLIAINTINTTHAPAKFSMRILSTSPYPMILVFESQRHVKNPMIEAEQELMKFMNISIMYPPSLISDFQIKLASWAGLDEITHDNLACIIYVVKASKDLFGCNVDHNEYQLPSLILEAFHYIQPHPTSDDPTLPVNTIETLSNEQVVKYMEDIASLGYPMLAMIFHQAYYRKIPILLKTVAIMKRGSCTFVEKARHVSNMGGSYGILVNTDNTFIDMPAGKENTTLCTSQFSVAKESDAYLLHTAAQSNEIIAVIKPFKLPKQAQNTSTTTKTLLEMKKTFYQELQLIIDEILDRWPNSIPAIPLHLILPNIDSKTVVTITKPILRSIADEGGRIAISGLNGWTYLDYHLAMFGPQDVPLGPYRLQMAFPPHGCDATQYTVRIKDTIVAILRGGGCSFGIKVINAQKLGAKAVIIVNTDDLKTMRLMALPDEIPLVKIPCIMVSRRIQYYLEEILSKYYSINQHIVSIQPMFYMSNYELRNTVILPKKLPSSDNHPT